MKFLLFLLLFSSGLQAQQNDDGWIDMITNGQYCKKCFNYNESDPLELEFKKLPEFIKNTLLTKNILNHKRESFYKSNLGIYIHESCIAEYGVDSEGISNLEKAYKEAMQVGTKCMQTLTDETMSVVGSHYTNMLRVLRPDVYARVIPQMLDVSRDPDFLFVKDINCVADLNRPKDPIANKYHALCAPDYDLCDATMSFLPFRNNSYDSCKVFDSKSWQEPKITCANNDNEDLTASENKYLFGVATVTNNTTLSITYKNKLEIIGHPVINIYPQATYMLKKSPIHFQSMLMHEFFHLMGYPHDNDKFPEYAYTCGAYCFMKEDSVKGSKDVIMHHPTNFGFFKRSCSADSDEGSSSNQFNQNGYIELFYEALKK